MILDRGGRNTAAPMGEQARADPCWCVEFSSATGHKLLRS